MIKVIPQTGLKLIIFLGLISLLFSCETNTAAHLKSYKTAYMQIDQNTKFKVYIAETDKQQRDGLSHIHPEDFSASEGMFFPGQRMHLRQFWMPETYFNLDVFFINQDFFVIDIHRNLKHHPKKGNRNEVPLSKEVYSQHVLELKANSDMAKKIKIGTYLKLIPESSSHK